MVDGEHWLITYARQVFGYDSFETIRVVVNINTNTISHNSTYFGIGNEIERVVTPDQLYQAMNVLLNSLENEWIVDHQTLIVDLNGRCWLDVDLNKKKEDGQIIKQGQCLINVS